MFQTGHRDIAHTCLKYLNYNDGSVTAPLSTDYKTIEGLVKSSRSPSFGFEYRSLLSPHLEKFPFLRYAIHYWKEHARKQMDQDIRDRALKLLLFEDNSQCISHHLLLPALHRYCYFHEADYQDPSTRHRQSELYSSEDHPPKCLAYHSMTEYCALHLSAYFGLDIIIKDLFDHIYNLDENFKLWGASTLEIAAGKGHEAVLRLLMQRKDIDINSVGASRITPLMRATRGGNTSIVRLLLTNDDIAINLQDSHLSALQWAVTLHHNDIVLLLENGAYTNDWGRRGYTTLMHAVDFDNHTALSLLLKYGANINSHRRKRRKGETALSLAVGKGDEAIVRFLLEKGADIQSVDKGDRSALHLAASYGHEAIVRLFLEEGADVHSTDIDGCSALHLATSYDHETIVRLLLREGANIHSTDGNGRSALHLAALNAHVAIVRLVLEYGADIQLQDSFGKKALHIVQEWLSEGANNWDWSESQNTKMRSIEKLLLERGGTV